MNRSPRYASWSRREFLGSAALLGVGAAAGFPVQGAEQEKAMKVPMLVGHRGAAALAPENTLAACRASYDAGVRWFEVDVRLSKDGRLFCFHDDRLERLTKGAGRADALDWAALSELEVLPGSFQGRFAGTRMPLLETLLAELPKDAHWCVEIKQDRARLGQVAKAVVETLNAAKAMDRARVIAFDPDDLRQLRKHGEGFPKLAIGPLIGKPQAANWEALAAEFRPEAMHFDHSLLTANPAWVEQCRKQGILVNAWTVNAPATAAKLAEIGVDEITTDDPVPVGAALKPKSA